MPVTNYATVNGQILYESTAGVRTSYVHDALGSVIATTDAGGAAQNTYRYAPYGTRISKTGNAADPKYGWVGGPGYRTTNRLHAEKYVRARHYGLFESRWSTMDHSWPSQFVYAYQDGEPISKADPSGRGACTPALSFSLEEACYAKCEYHAYCDWDLKFLFTATVQPRGCKSCRYYQWWSEGLHDSYNKDDGEGWPPKWSGKSGNLLCTDRSCTYTDNPGPHGIGFCIGTAARMHWYFHTIVTCDPGYRSDWAWEIKGTVNCCDASCSVRTPYRVKPLNLLGFP